MTNRVFFFLTLSVFTACNSTTGDQKDNDEKITLVVANDSIPMERIEVSPDPVATYSVSVPDELNDFKFSVKLYETPLRFRYHVSVTYKMMEVKDSVDIPNFGHQPKVDVRKFQNDLSCMIGFYDAEGNFKELKKVEAIDNQIKTRQVRRYGVGTVKKKQVE